MKLLITMIFIISCSTTHKKSYESTEIIWNVIENASREQWGDDQLIAKLGKPDQVFSRPTKDIYLGWTYKSKESGFQEWGISFSNDMIVKSITHLPQDMHRHEFTVDKIMTRWKGLNCKHETREILKPHVIKKERYLSCDSGKKIVNYNAYNEVESIVVK